MLKKGIKFLFSFYSLKSKILINLIVFTTIPFILLSGFVYIYMYENMVDDLNKNLYRELTLSVANINNELLKYVNKSNNIITYLTRDNGLLQKIISGNQDDAEIIMDFNYTLSTLLIGFEPVSSNMSTITIYLENYRGYNGLYIEDIGRIKDMIGKNALKSSISETLWNKHVQTDKRNNTYISFYRNISNILDRDGILELNIPYTGIRRFIDNIDIPDGGSIVHRNSSGEIIYKRDWPSGSEKDKGQTGEKGFLVVKSSSMVDGSDITITISGNIIMERYRSIILLVFLAFLIFIILIIIGSGITSKKITKSLNDFISYLKDNDDILLNAKLIEISEKDEISTIKKRFINIIGKMNNIYRELIDTKSQNNMLELELLQARINPHLLYNSLSVIKWSALEKKDEKTTEIVDAMSDYYRIALNRGNNLIEVCNELNMIKEYIRIVNYTHSYRYKLCISVDEKILNIKILKHLLQPIVENAVLHGLNEKGEDGKVVIKGYMEGNDLVFRIIDNGYGMDGDKIKKILDFDYMPSYGGQGGYGIKNLIKRIKIYYGSEYGIDIESEINAGTAVIIKVKEIID